jgi:hypothetical protein
VGLDPQETVLDWSASIVPVAVMPLDGGKAALRLREKPIVLRDGFASLVFGDGWWCVGDALTDSLVGGVGGAVRTRSCR